MRRVLVVSPVRIYREGIAEGLSRDGPFCAESAPPALASLRSPPDLLVFDAGADDALPIARSLTTRWPDARMVVLGVETAPDVLRWAQIGASGFIGWDAPLDAVARVVEAAARGELLCSPGLALALCRRVTALSAALDVPGAPLTAREREIARLLERGLSNKEIASQLSIQAATVKNHVHRILGKLGAKRRGEAASRIRQLHAELLTE